MLGHILGTNRKGHPSEKQPHLLNVCHVFLRFFAFFFLANDVAALHMSLPIGPGPERGFGQPREGQQVGRIVRVADGTLNRERSPLGS